tara:strand:- start:1203 stop:1664 length:462 start_codon:yes stop_codon:yes gene_type:complete
MARITVEDCIDKFPSRFELVLVASNRARKLHSGENTTLDKDNDKNTVIALREIAEEALTIDVLKNDLIEEYQTTTFSEDEELDEPQENFSENNQDDEIQSNVNELSSSNVFDEEVSKDESKPDMEYKDDVADKIEESENLSKDKDTNLSEEAH